MRTRLTEYLSPIRYRRRQSKRATLWRRGQYSSSALPPMLGRVSYAIVCFECTMYVNVCGEILDLLQVTTRYLCIQTFSAPSESSATNRLPRDDRKIALQGMVWQISNANTKRSDVYHRRTGDSDPRGREFAGTSMIQPI